MKTNLQNYEERFVDYMEGQLSPDEMREVETFVTHHPELEEDFRLFAISKLEPDPKVRYENKEALMHPSDKLKVIPLFVRIASAAAVVALLLGIGWFFLRQGQDPTVTEQPLIANLTPIRATALDLTSPSQELAPSSCPRPFMSQKTKSHTVKFPAQPKTSPMEDPSASLETAELSDPIYPIESIELIGIAQLEPKRLRQLPWNGSIEYGSVENEMIKEVEARFAQLEPYDLFEDWKPSPFAKGESIAASLGQYFFGNASRVARNLYKQTAKTVMTAYYTADGYIDEKRGAE